MHSLLIETSQEYFFTLFKASYSIDEGKKLGLISSISLLQKRSNCEEKKGNSLGYHNTRLNPVKNCQEDVLLTQYVVGSFCLADRGG